MNRFPFLSFLTRKNEHCSQFFRRSAYMTPNSSSGNGDKAHLKGGKFIHWKKRFQTRFETEDAIAVGNEEKVDTGIPPTNWHFSIQSTNTTSSTSTDCQLCDKPFPTRRLLNQHKSFTHFPPFGGQQGYCYLPYFSQPGKFDRVKRETSQLGCSLCKKWFAGLKTGSVDDYLEGLKNKAKEKEEWKRRGRKEKALIRRRVCELCSKILSNRKGLERHMLIHTGEKPFPCDICGKLFRRKDNCVRHKKTAHLFKKPRKPRRKRSQMASNVLTLNAPSAPNN